MRLLSLPLLALAVGVCVAAEPPAPPAEFAPNQTAAKPAPFDVKLVDQGKWDPRLKGILAPDGFKTEIVADESVITNPVGMTFAPDGTFYVMERKPDPGREWYPLEETFRYRDGSTKKITTMKKFVTDPVKMTSDLSKTPFAALYRSTFTGSVTNFFIVVIFLVEPSR